MYKVFIRKLRRQIENGVRKGFYPLRVMGSTKTGFVLLAERGKSLVLVGNRTFRKQNEAIRFGHRHLGQVARKKMLKAA